MTLASLDALAVKHVPCPRCHQPPGARCRTRSGARSTRVHSTRLEAIVAGWRLGYAEGGLDASHLVETVVHRYWREHTDAPLTELASRELTLAITDRLRSYYS